jgi:putative transposase
MPRWRLFYHVVWATQQRLPLLDDRLSAITRETIAAVATSHRCLIQAIGIMPDHVHVAVSIPPSVAISKVMQGFKGASSKRINLAGTAFGEFHWQTEYGVISFAEPALAKIIDYVEHQREHHANGTLRPTLEDVGEFVRTTS